MERLHESSLSLTETELREERKVKGRVYITKRLRFILKTGGTMRGFEAELPET